MKFVQCALDAQKALLCIGLLFVGTAPSGADAADSSPIVRALGTLEPAELIEVGSDVSGKIISFAPDGDGSKTIDYGSKVKKGTALAQLDPRLYQLDLSQARAKLQKAEIAVRLAKVKLGLAEIDLQRAKKQAAGKDADGSELDRAQQVVEVAKAEVDERISEVELPKTDVQRAEMNLAGCTIRSPVDGIVIDRRCNVGQSVAGNLNAPSMFLIVPDLKAMLLWTNVDESKIGRVALYQTVHFTVDAFPGRQYTGKITQIRLNAQATQNVVMYTVVCGIDNVDEKLLPYLTANVEIITEKK
ncbi:MAG TPA: efflux RND transporter periplasmic adaptor subunit [Pirellulales bacterium]|jgi:HlyD family secretion protein